jgi:hypothetical protein
MVEREGQFDESQSSFLFPEYEMSVELEEEEKEESNSDDDKDQQDGEKKERSPKDPLDVKTSPSTKIWDDALTEGGEDEASDAALTQADYNKALSEQKYDPVYVSFLARIAKGGTQQVLRYCEQSIHNEEHEYNEEIPISIRDKGRLFINQGCKKNASNISVPPCSQCHAPRALEFQVTVF